MIWQPRVVKQQHSWTLLVDQKTSKEDRRIFMVDDWRYSKEKLKLREQALLILLSRYGTELDNTRKSKYANQSIYAVSYTHLTLPTNREV